jgi:hypothetical protein
MLESRGVTFGVEFRRRSWSACSLIREGGDYVLPFEAGAVARLFSKAESSATIDIGR